MVLLPLIIAGLVGAGVLETEKLSRNQKIGVVAGSLVVSIFFSAATYCFAKFEFTFTYKIETDI